MRQAGQTTLKFALLCPIFVGHRSQWLDQMIKMVGNPQISIDCYVLDRYLKEGLSTNYDLKQVNFIRFLDEKHLMSDWKKALADSTTTGIIWDADKILPNLLFIRSSQPIRAIILRPYLESYSILGITRFILKHLLINTILIGKHVKFGFLSIPFAHETIKHGRWVSDNYTLSMQETPVSDNSLQISRKGPYRILVPGYQQARKDPLLAYKIVEELRGLLNREVHLIFAGIQEPAWTDILNRYRSTMLGVVEINRVLSEEEYLTLIRECSAVILPYENRGASGVVLNVLAAGRPLTITGSKKWRRLEQKSGGYLRLSSRDAKEAAVKLASQMDLSSKSLSSLLQSESIPAIHLFLCGE